MFSEYTDKIKNDYTISGVDIKILLSISISDFFIFKLKNAPSDTIKSANHIEKKVTFMDNDTKTPLN